MWTPSSAWALPRCGSSSCRVTGVTRNCRDGPSVVRHRHRRGHRRSGFWRPQRPPVLGASCSLGMPLERWRAMRPPSAVDAARLALGFGRLVERAARGFVTDVAEATDFGVGPGPTPFSRAAVAGATRRSGRAASRAGRSGADRPVVLGDGLRGAVACADLRVGQRGGESRVWIASRNCLDELEAAATAVHESRERGEPVGVNGVFDHPVIASDRVPWWDCVQTIMATRWFRWLRVVVALLVFLLAVLNLSRHSASSHHDASRLHGDATGDPPAPIPSPSKPVHRSAPPRHTTTPASPAAPSPSPPQAAFDHSSGGRDHSHRKRHCHTPAGSAERRRAATRRCASSWSGLGRGRWCCATRVFPPDR